MSEHKGFCMHETITDGRCIACGEDGKVLHVDVGLSLDSLYKAIAEWQAATFPGRDAHAAVEHLRREANELWASYWDDSTDPPKRYTPPLVGRGEEAADNFLLLVATCETGGIDLWLEVFKKLKKNRARKWSEPDAQGVIEHERGSE